MEKVNTGFKGTPNVNGRPKGAVNKIKKSNDSLFKALASYLIDSQMEKFKKELDSLKGKDFVMAFINLYKIKPNELESLDANDELLKIFKSKLK